MRALNNHSDYQATAQSVERQVAPVAHSSVLLEEQPLGSIRSLD
jgi:hypothetical protein